MSCNISLYPEVLVDFQTWLTERGLEATISEPFFKEIPGIYRGQSTTFVNIRLFGYRTVDLIGVTNQLRYADELRNWTLGFTEINSDPRGVSFLRTETVIYQDEYGNYTWALKSLRSKPVRKMFEDYLNRRSDAA